MMITIITYYSVGKVIISTLVVSLVLLIIYIAYKKIIARVNKGIPDSSEYCVLYSLEQEPASGLLEFYFTCEQEKNVRLELLNEDMTFNTLIAENAFKSGGNIVRFDSTTLANGTYFYCLQTDNQKTMKKVELQNP